MGPIVYILISLALTVAAGVGIMAWAVNSPYLTARWRGCGRRVFWYSVLFMLCAGSAEMLMKFLLSRAGLKAHPFAYYAVYYVAVVGLAEELGKLLAVIVGTSNFTRVTSALDVFPYAAVSAGAFSVLENVLYSLQGRFNWAVSIARSVFSTPIHICCTCVAVLGILHGRTSGKKRWGLAGFGMAAVLHGLYDLFLTSVNDPRLVGHGAGAAVLETLFLLAVGVCMAIMVAQILRVPARYAKTHSVYTCPCCGWNTQTPLVCCARCGAPGLIHLVMLPRLPKPKKREKE